MARLPIKKITRPRALVPAPKGGDLATTTLNAAESLANDPRVKKYFIESDNSTGITKIRAIGHNGQNVVQGLLGPGLSQTSTCRPVRDTAKERREARDASIVTYYVKGLSQDKTAGALIAHSLLYQRFCCEKAIAKGETNLVFSIKAPAAPRRAIAVTQDF
ncbi:hypothetical protein [Sphingomonas sp. STIS6.2]|uniref:hypothetical protein n=1 Tax=Sphingomonas sp. STIS6.2 TaxID=1379700 RepID=UPI0004DB4EB2|nr:hypothetical protein [Sphingomonas sp. STIS6.2]